ncbi:hypothetical protein SRHO_G00159020 [Serrasalmus rhombeus]
MSFLSLADQTESVDSLRLTSSHGIHSRLLEGRGGSISSGSGAEYFIRSTLTTHCIITMGRKLQEWMSWENCGGSKCS